MSDKRDGVPTRISLLLSDVDGTLVTKKKVLTPRTLEAVGALRRAGIAFAITSSRPPAGLLHLIEPLGLTTPIAGFNSGLIVDPQNQVLRVTALAAEYARQTIDLLARERVDIWVFQGNQWLVTNPAGDYVAHEEMTIHYPPTVVEDFTPYLDGVTKIVGSSPDFGHLKRTEAIVHEALGAHASVALSQAYYLDITDHRAHKGMTVMALSEMLGIPVSEIATIGDGENDIRMFERSGFSIAMGNALPSVKEHAMAVTGTNEEDGFAQAVERLVLPRAA